MLDYLTLFNTHADYNTYINSQDKVLPNVSYCENENEVHYTTYIAPMIVYFDVQDISSPTTIYYYAGANVKKIEVDDGTVIEPTGGNVSHQFSTTGEHLVKFYFNPPPSDPNADPTVIGAYGSPLFYNFTIGMRVIIPRGYIAIGSSAFSNCTGLTSVTLPDTLYAVNGFNSCISLTSITIPYSVTVMDNTAFSYCSSLTSIVVDSNNKVFDSRNNCNAIIETATNSLLTGCRNTIIPNTVTSIYRRAFSNCTGLTSITIPDSVTSISVKSKYVTSYEDGSFSNCTNLTSVTIGNGVTEIGTYAFYGCTSLTGITIQATTPPTLSNLNAFNNTNGCPIYVPSASVNAYKAANNWSNLSSRIQAIS